MAGSALSSNFGLIRFTVVEIEQFSYFGILAWNCLFTPTFRGFLGIFSTNDVIYHCNPQKALPCLEIRRLSHKAWKSVQRIDLGAGSRKKRHDRTGQDRTVKKVTKALYFTYLGEAPLNRFSQKNCAVVAVPDVIMCANFELKFSEVTILQGVHFHVFLLILSWALQQCSATALPVITHTHHATFVAFVISRMHNNSLVITKEYTK